MNLTPELKQRLVIFGGGAVIGSILSVMLLIYGFTEVSQKKPILHSVVLSTCDLKAGDIVERKCVETRDVAEQYLPPKVLFTDDLDWHIGRKLITDVKDGSAFRTVDFAPPTSEGYIR